MGGRLVLLAASIAATLVFLELGCRLVRGRYYLLHWPNLVLELREGSARYAHQALRHEPELGFVPRPGHVPSHATHEDDGMRRTPSPAGIADRPVVLATGDSFTYGAEVGDAGTWPSQLQALLGVRVVNGGVASYGLDQIVMRTERLTGALRPAAVVVSFISDDLRRNELSRFVGFDKPYLIQAGDALVPAGQPVPSPLSARQSLSFWDHAFGWSALLQTVLPRIGWPEDWPYDSVRVLPRGAGERMACPLMRRLAALSVPTLVVAQYDEEAWDARLTAEQRRLAAVVLRCAEQAGLATLDTFNMLDARGTHGLFLAEGHLTAEGNALIAMTIAPGLRQLGLPLP